MPKTLCTFRQFSVSNIVLNDSENWSLNRSNKKKIDAAEMRFLRPTAGYTLLDKKKRISEIGEQLGILNINDKIKKCKINWWEHVQRIDDKRQPKKIKLQT